MNAPHVSDGGRLHVAQDLLSRVTTIHKIWQAGDHGFCCYLKNCYGYQNTPKIKINEHKSKSTDVATRASKQQW